MQKDLDKNFVSIELISKDLSHLIQLNGFGNRKYSLMFKYLPPLSNLKNDLVKYCRIQKS